MAAPSREGKLGTWDVTGSGGKNTGTAPEGAEVNGVIESEGIKSSIQIVERADSPATQRLRVAAYVRVPGEQDEQLNSCEAQARYYTECIKANPVWEFIGVFSDVGITGNSTKNRDGFNRIIELALNGRIDLIITQSISRFVRNTVDMLSIARKLKEAGVEVVFEKENLSTFDSRFEVILTNMDILAQEESRSASKNFRCGLQKSIKEHNISGSSFCRRAFLRL